MGCSFGQFGLWSFWGLEIDWGDVIVGGEAHYGSESCCGEVRNTLGDETTVALTVSPPDPYPCESSDRTHPPAINNQCEITMNTMNRPARVVAGDTRRPLPQPPFWHTNAYWPETGVPISALPTGRFVFARNPRCVFQMFFELTAPTHAWNWLWRPPLSIGRAVLSRRPRASSMVSPRPRDSPRPSRSPSQVTG